MTRIRIALASAVIIVAAAVGAIITTTGGNAHTAAAIGQSISVKQTPLGPTLIGPNGRTLYLFAADKPNVSKLSAAGQAVWPPVTATVRPHAAGGAQAAAIGLITSPGRGRQVTYDGHPLYYFVGDQQPGQTHGQGLNEFGARWYVLSPAGKAVTATVARTPRPASPAPGAAGGGATGGGSYSY